MNYSPQVESRLLPFFLTTYKMGVIGTHADWSTQGAASIHCRRGWVTYLRYWGVLSLGSGLTISQNVLWLEQDGALTPVGAQVFATAARLQT